MNTRRLGQALRRTRDSLDWPQRATARLMGRSQAWVAETERGTKPPSTHDLVALGDLYDDFALDLELAAFVTSGRIGSVAAVNGGAFGALAAMQDELQELQDAITTAQRLLYQFAEDPNYETLRELRHHIRDIRYVGNAAEVSCDGIYRESAKALSESYRESRKAKGYTIARTRDDQHPRALAV